MGRLEKRRHYNAMETQVRRWIQEWDSLWRDKRNTREVMDLPRPVFRGYIVTFALTPAGKKELNDIQKKLFRLTNIRFFVRDKSEVKALVPDPKKHSPCGYVKSPDFPPLNRGYLWPGGGLRKGEIENELAPKLGISKKELLEYFIAYEREGFFWGEAYKTVYRLNIKEEHFRFKSKKFHQRQTWVEDAYLDSRLDFLSDKLWGQGLWNRYGGGESTNMNDWGKPPRSFYKADKTGINRDLPYHRARFKQATNKIINYAKSRN